MTARIAVYATGDLAVRLSRVILAETGTEIGLFDEDSARGRVHRVEQLAEWDVLVVDEVSIGSRVHIERALALEKPVVLAEDDASFDTAAATVVSGARDGARLAEALARSGLGGTEELLDAQLAWTVPGHPLRIGVGVTFPDPVGALWADSERIPELPFPATGMAAPINAPWRAVTARLTMAAEGGITQRVFGIADDRNFLDAVTIAAAALTAADGAYPKGTSGPGDPDGQFLRTAEASGLHIAAFTAA